MINTLSEWTKNLCLSMVVVSILEMILPNNKTKKYINVVMGLYILFNILSPIISNSCNIDSNNIDIEKYINKTFEETSAETSKENKMENSDIDQSSMNARLEQLYSEELENDITKKLENKGYLVNSCKVKCNLDGKDARIEKITIKISKSANIENDSKSDNKKNSKNYNPNNSTNDDKENGKSNNLNNNEENSESNNLNNVVNKNDNDNEKDKSGESLENKLVAEIQEIKKVNININSQENNQENDQENKSENNSVNSSTKITNEDILKIKDFITKEYGVDEKCLKIN